MGLRPYILHLPSSETEASCGGDLVNHENASCPGCVSPIFSRQSLSEAESCIEHIYLTRFQLYFSENALIQKISDFWLNFSHFHLFLLRLRLDCPGTSTPSVTGCFASYFHIFRCV